MPGQGAVISLGIHSGAFAATLDVGSRGKGGVKAETWGWPRAPGEGIPWPQITVS